MKKTFLFLSICLLLKFLPATAQQKIVPAAVVHELTALIDSYSMARENQDTVLLKAILTPDIDQLVSSGEWRLGLATAVEGMKRSSQVNEGKRTLKVERVRLLDPNTALIDARYTIEPADGSSARNMWSTFIAVYQDDRWKITAIRNMLPTGK
ncbi:SgcJ/EcaC family oxidoreductase [Lunatibacter salilacus]|uniref:SgcJ/EcaC family oxidoreductase n=1 Tax=Lunatibacter salilacus TaxID=2483804 RepID=UPI00131E4D0B|nr:SgcJ/EcaC family oxidoreductase [Lunatibacter salilacus]